MKRQILMAPFHFPPMGGSSGVQRSLFFSKCLEKYGWQALVLTAHPRVHEEIDVENSKEISENIILKRTFAIDIARHLPFGGRYPQFLAIPDRWSSWILSGVIGGWLMSKKHNPEIIWTTYPIASSHLIGFFLHKLTGLPWVADFRDPMTRENSQMNPSVFKCFRWIETKTLESASYVVVTTSSLKKEFLQRYGNEYADKIKVIQNGFDEEKFAKIEASLAKNKEANISREKNRPLRLVHSGYLYLAGRSPEYLFKAISELKKENIMSSEIMSLELRDPGYQEFEIYKKMIMDFDIEDIVKLLPAIPHEENIADILDAHALLLIQGSMFNRQIPAKAYEYIRAGKPVVALTDEEGDSAKLLESLGVSSIAPLDDKDKIKIVIKQIREICENFKPLEAREIEKFSRQYGTKQLAELFETL